jgi:hypothetical protein
MEWLRNSLVLTALILNTCLASSAYAQGSAYAVFKVSYSETGGDVVGGVGGTAFFISSKKAVTAYHVLNSESFKPAPGFSKTRVWLVHENKLAIEILPSQVRFNAKNDITNIEFIKDQAESAVIFSKKRELSGAFDDKIESEGFIANTAGPKMEWKDGRIEITAVPTLSRVHLKGSIIRKAVVDLRATDVTLVKTPTYQLTYGPIVGTSGGPVLIHNEIIGINSFADPTNRQSTWAVSIEND